MAYRDELGALEAREAGLARELEDVRVALGKLRAPRRLALLRTPRIASPCDVPWDEMEGDGHVRRCARCDKDVYDLTGLTRVEAAELLARDDVACVRFYERPDGTVLTSDCPMGTKRRRRVRRLGVAAAGLVGLAGVLEASAIARHGQEAGAAKRSIAEVIAAGSSGDRVRAEGTLVHGTLDASGPEVRFQLESRGAVLAVRYPGRVLPDTFRDEPGSKLAVWVEGELLPDGTFRASSVVPVVSQGYRLR